MGLSSPTLRGGCMESRKKKTIGQLYKEFEQGKISKEHKELLMLYIKNMDYHEKLNRVLGKLEYLSR